VNPEYVFAAYGEFLYAWNAIDGPNKGVSITEFPYDIVKVCDFTTLEPTSLNDTEVSSTDSSTVQEEPCYNYQPKPVVVALLLHEDRLTAIVSEDAYTYSSIMDTTQWTPKIISDYTKLTIQIYDISNVPSDDSPLTLLAKSEKPIKGSYTAALSNKNIVTLAVTSSIDTYSLVSDLYRYNTQYCGLNSTEYTKLAVETASNQTETFIASMLEELQLQLVGTCKSVVQVREHNCVPRSMLRSLTSSGLFTLSSSSLPHFPSVAYYQHPLILVLLQKSLLLCNLERAPKTLALANYWELSCKS